MDVIIVDSSAEITSRIKESLSELSAIRVIYEAHTYNDAINMTRNIKAAIIIMDISFSLKASLNAISQIKELCKEVVFIALSARLKKKEGLQFSVLGVEYFFDKYHEFEKIPVAIKAITSKN